MPILEEVDEVLNKYKELKYDKSENKIFGSLFIGQSDFYNIEIVLAGYPNHFPFVYEIDERIPRKVERHIYPKFGNCCFTTRAKEQILLKTKIKSLLSFVKEILVPYLRNNSFYEINERYFGDEHSHNQVDGIVEGYQDILGISDVLRIGTLIYSEVFKNSKLKIRDNCYCGSGLKMKHCNNGQHTLLYRNFRKIDKSLLKNDLAYISMYVEREKQKEY